MMLDYDYTKCVPKIEGCIIPLEIQNDNTMADYWDDEKQVYICPECIPGFYWSETDKTCVRCSDMIQNCNECVTGERCTLCDQDYFPSYLGDSCERYIENCKTGPENYINNGQKYVCPECRDGYINDPQTGICESCDIDLCLDCESAGFCSECEFPYVLVDKFDVDKKLIGKICEYHIIQDCLDEPSDYIYDEESDNFICNRCRDNFVWDEDEYECIECKDAFPGCMQCMGEKCHICEDHGEFPTYLKDGCMKPLKNCNDTIVPHDYEVLDEYYICSQCDQGFYFDWYTWECEPCEDHVHMCNECY